MSISNRPGMGGSPDESQVAFSLTTSQWPTRARKRDTKVISSASRSEKL
jgi:hypothetical protein